MQNKNIFPVFNDVSFKFDEIQFSHVESYWSEIATYYQYNRLYLVTDGGGKITIDKEEIQLLPGHIYCIPPHSIIKSECNDYLDHFYIHFRILPQNNNLNNYLSFTHEIDATAFDKNLFQMMCDNFPPKDASQDYIIESSCQLLLVKLLSSAKLLSNTALRFNNTLKYINEHLYQKITLEELSDIASLEKKYFCTLFKNTFGITPLDYVNSQKLKHSMTYLLDDSYTIKEVAYKVLFNDEFYYSRLFKKKFGISPSEFRRQYIKYPQKKSPLILHD